MTRWVVGWFVCWLLAWLDGKFWLWLVGCVVASFVVVLKKGRAGWKTVVQFKRALQCQHAMMTCHPQSFGSMS